VSIAQSRDLRKDSGLHESGRTILASVAAIGSVLAASSCCLPILPFLAAAGFASASALLSVARPYLLVASILFIGYGFYQAWRTKKCGRRTSIVGSILLLVSSVLVILSMLFPQVIASAAADLLTR
jgi:cytochrome bd-type quinol oxidase subunit 2